MKFIIFLAFLAVSNGAPRPSDDDHVVRKSIGKIPKDLEEINSFTQRTFPVSGGQVDVGPDNDHVGHIPKDLEDILSFTQRTFPVSGGPVDVGPEREDIVSHKHDGAHPEGIFHDDGPVREDIVSHEVKKPLLGHDGHGILHTTQKPLLGHDGHGIRHTTSEPEGHLHGGIFCATETPDGAKDESLFRPFAHTMVPPYIDPDIGRGKLPGGISIADAIKEFEKNKTTKKPATK